MSSPPFTQPEAVTLSREEREPSYFDVGDELLHNILDQRGKPRLAAARNFLLDSVCQENISGITRAFEFWKNYHEYILLMGRNLLTDEEQFVGVKASKRGNDVFTRRLDRELGFLGNLEGIQLFSLEDFEKNSYMPTNLLWITLTFNPHLCSMKEAWQKIGHYWNLWITNLRNKYGRILYLQMPEAFPDPSGAAYGYCHIHTVLLFMDHSFNTFPSWEKGREGKGGWVFRILERDEVKKQGKWMAHVDIKAIQSGRALGGYLRKHTKNVHGGDDPGALVTQSLLWLHRKKTYSMSSGFRDAFNDLISSLHNSKTSKQIDLMGEPVIEWVWSFHGVAAAQDLGVDPSIWVVSLDKKIFRKFVTIGLPPPWSG